MKTRNKASTPTPNPKQKLFCDHLLTTANGNYIKAYKKAYEIPEDDREDYIMNRVFELMEKPYIQEYIQERASSINMSEDTARIKLAGLMSSTDERIRLNALKLFFDMTKRKGEKNGSDRLEWILQRDINYKKTRREISNELHESLRPENMNKKSAGIYNDPYADDAINNNKDDTTQAPED